LDSRFGGWFFGGLPAVVYPEPVGWVAANGSFEGAVDVEHNGAC